MARAIHALVAPRPGRVLDGADVPSLFLYGEADVRSPLPLAEELASRIPGSELIFGRGAGHQLNMEAA